jgi:hypothetical protein
MSQEAGRGVPAANPRHRRNRPRRRPSNQRRRPIKAKKLPRRHLRNLLNSQIRQRNLPGKRVFRNPLEAPKQRNKQVKPLPNKLQQNQSKNLPQSLKRARVRPRKRKLRSLLSLLRPRLTMQMTRWTSKTRIIQMKLQAAMSTTRIKLRLQR